MSTIVKKLIPQPEGERSVVAAGAFPSSLRAAIYLLVLVLASISEYIDQVVFALQVTPIQRDIHLTDGQIGWLQGVAYISACVAIFPLGVLIDRVNRTWMLVGTITSWSAATALFGYSDSFWSMLLCRLGMGAAGAGLYPLAYSLIGDLVPIVLRARAMFGFFVLALLGGNIATIVGGYLVGVVERHDVPILAFAGLSPWRQVFLLVAVAGIGLALLSSFLREPFRQLQESGFAAEGDEGRLRPFLARKGLGVALLIVGLVSSYSGVVIFTFWLPTILRRMFDVQAEQAGIMVGLSYGCGAIIGVLAAAGAHKFLSGKGGETAERTILRFAAAGVAIAGWAMLVVPAQPIGLLVVWAFYLFFAYAVRSVGTLRLTNMVPNRLRGQVNALYLIPMTLMTALCPPLVGTLSDSAFQAPAGLLVACGAVLAPFCTVAALSLWWLPGASSNKNLGTARI
jgi:MFS family permease